MTSRLVAYQGEPGAYSEIAALRFGTPEPFESFDDAFEAVEKKQVACAVIPIENSLGGSIHHNYDLLIQHPVHIVAETFVKVEHCLLGLPGSTLENPGRVLSHPQALAQCRNFFTTHPALKAEVAYDTAGSAKIIAEQNDPSNFAIASKRAGELYGLDILQENLADEEWNITRFFCITHEQETTRLPSIPDCRECPQKTSIVFTLPNEPGSLFKAMATLALRNIDMTKIESRPFRKKAFEYLFYVDFIGRSDDRNVQNALSHLREFATMVNVLGSYGIVE
ncbi:prephenate dehydratase [Prosthecochloris sp. N3]|uniref:Prephenate dehydratase n=1 Tax=Prosthecochloris ethylica TaxID=2743976 RepID=A0ABR9XQ24_9CHLB|nr:MULTISPECIES: prephenate dehydratase [Prosthecochloris]MEC9485895.1 prephenate dehydratase [Prosthecochloris sp.]MBF0586519.1 prephenate dehydratase [Prosthecochloris ethylica]MBF0636132.1 prephenate dehydratase [Prosthecochloris ethylica]NUK47731.1 prephenate dehydratase [Prosthecochloris ethylica]RNA64393.1 prephenate dehydratase [Prosthecochloris sp. ZM_2]